MSSVGGLLGALSRLRHWPASALGLRLAMLVAPTAALLCATVAGGAPPASYVALVVLLSTGFAVAPDSGFGLLALGSVVAWWCLVPDEGLHPAVLVAAVLLTVAHVAGLVAANGPPGVPVPAQIGAVWVARAACVLLAAPVVWFVARVAAEADPDRVLWQAGLLAAVLSVVVAGLGLSAGRTGERA